VVDGGVKYSSKDMTGIESKYRLKLWKVFQRASFKIILETHTLMKLQED
jgi:hypothetical protein